MELEIKKDFTKLEPRWIETGDTRERFKKEIAFAIQAINGNGLLQKCTRESLLSAVFNVTLTGLSLNPVLQYAALVPRWNGRDKQYEASLEPMYQGLIKLALSSGKYKAFVSAVVYHGDDLEVDYSDIKKIIRHVPYFQTGKDRGDIKAVYCIAILDDGTQLGELMTWDEVKAIRDRSESYKAFAAGKISNTVWNSDTAEMCKKTVTKRLLKYLDKGESEKLANAINLDNQIHGFRPFADINDIQYLTQLIEEELMIDDQTLTALRLRLRSIQFRDEADKLKEDIFNNYIQEDHNLSARQLAHKVDNAVKRDNT